METHNIQDINIYNVYNIYSNRDAPGKKTITTDKNTLTSEAQKNLAIKRSDNVDKPALSLLKTSPLTTPPLPETEIIMSVEKDLNIVITTVKDKNKGEIIRQIPNEEAVERLKLFKNSQKQQPLKHNSLFLYNDHH